MTPDLTAVADALDRLASENATYEYLDAAYKELAVFQVALAAVLRAVAAEHPKSIHGTHLTGGLRDICAGHPTCDRLPDWPCRQLRAVLAAVAPLLPLLGAETAATEKENDHG